MTEHRQVKVYNYCSTEEVEVDEGIADLLQLLWNNEVNTVLSCEDNAGGKIWIEFREEDYKKLYSQAVPYHRDNCVYGDRNAFCEAKTCLLYYLDVVTDTEFNAGCCSDMGKEEFEFYGNLPPFISYYVSMRFPKADKQLFMTHVKNVYSS